MTYNGQNDRRKTQLNDEDRNLLFAIANKLNTKQERNFFGFRVQELSIIFGAVLLVLGFYIRTNDAMTRLVKSTDWLMGFSKNSDNYHSTVMGMQFEQGQPKDTTYRLIKEIK